MKQPALPGIAVLAVAGLAIAGYLTYVHYQHLPLACANTGPFDCGAVTSSAYSELFGLPVSLLGMGWFAVEGALALVRRNRLLIIWGFAGLAFVLYLVYAELVVIHKLCEWCTAIHLLVATSLLLALSRLGTLDSTA